MLERTFCHIQGIGPKTEKRLWSQGADTWEAFLAQPERFPAARARLPYVIDMVNRSRAAHSQDEYRFFASHLPSKEHWRALESFHGRVGYLDIETNGGTDEDSVTVIGLYDGNRMRHFVRGENLLEFEEAMDDIAMLVTFFGGGFDIPVLRRAFPRLKFDQLHLDLCPALRRLGFSGGLKRIERAVGLARSDELDGLSGWDAVRLWRQWRYGQHTALQTLLDYNTADVMNMVPLARLAYRELAARATDEGPDRELLMPCRV